MARESGSIMDDQASPSAIDIHDLRHHLSLLALDLRLSREDLDAANPLPSIAALLGRLDRGLSALTALIAGEAESGVVVQRLDRSELVTTIWDRFRRAGHLRPESSSFRCESPLAWPGEERHWHSLLVNLLENATKAAPEGPVSLQADARGLQITNGGEMPPDAVVEALRQGLAPAPRAGSSRGRGLGLMLAAARALNLSLELELDEGCCSFHLRRDRADAVRVLIVEDDSDLRTMLAEYIRADGFRVDVLEHGNGEAPAPGSYAAVIADRGLPGRSGELLLADLRKIDPSLFTLLLTGASDVAGRSFPGVDAVIIKPGLDRLRELLAPLLDKEQRT
jgi:CheY-like chemotaxis protein